MKLIKKSEIIDNLPETPDVVKSLIDTSATIVDIVNQFDSTIKPTGDIKKDYETFKEIKGLPEKVNKARLDGLRDIRKIETEYKKFIDENIIEKIKPVVAEFKTVIEKYEKEEKAKRQAAQLERVKNVKKTPLPMPTQGIVFKKRKSPWQFEILDVSKIPEKYLKTIVDKEAVDVAIKSGVRTVEGLRIFQSESIV